MCVLSLDMACGKKPHSTRILEINDTMLGILISNKALFLQTLIISDMKSSGFFMCSKVINDIATSKKSDSKSNFSFSKFAF